MGRYYREYRDRFNTINPMARFLIVAAFIFAAVLAAPRLLPYTASGLNCESLAQPLLDPYNQSVLRATLSADRAYAPLRLEVVPDSPTALIQQGVALNVRFINDSMAPLNIFLLPESVIFRYNQEENGLLIFIQRSGTGGSLAEGSSTNPPLQIRRQYNTREVRTIPPRQRCTQRVEILPERLARLGVTPGQYRFVAFYRNTSSGELGALPAATPTVFLNQGVYTGEVQSNDALITLN